MAYLNINNMCTFEGRLTADPELTYLSTNGGQQGVAKCKLKIAVDRNMTKDQKQKAVAEGKETADFIPVDVIGAKAEFVANYFTKGSGIRVVASFKTYSYMKDGVKTYGYNFDAVDVGFTVGGANNGGVQSDNSNSFMDNELSFQSVDDNDLPF